jgi:gliding motility-associated-like protein
MKLNFTLAILLAFSLSAPAQIINRIAGIPGTPGNSGDGGPASTATLAMPYCVAVDNAGNIYLGDWWNRRVRKIDASRNITAFAGNGTVMAGNGGDGIPALNASLHTIDDIAIDNNGNVFIADYARSEIRKVNAQGIISTVAGNGLSSSDNYGVGDGGPAVAAPLYTPMSVAVDQAGNMYIAETSSGVIRKVNTQGIISTIAGRGFWDQGYSGDGGPASQAKLNIPTDLAIDLAGNIYIADLGNHVIRKINSQGVITTFAGTGIKGYSGDGGPATSARLFRPFGVATDNAGNVYIAEDSNHVIRKVDVNGIITTVAGTGMEGYSGDGGLAINARLAIPQRLAVDNMGNIYVPDWVNHTVRKIGACVNSVPSSVSISSSSTVACANTPLVFTANAVNGGSSPRFLWQVNDQPAGNGQLSFTISALADGDIINCIMISSETCTLPATSNSISVTIKGSPVINLPAQYAINPGASIQLNPVITGNVAHIEWTPVTSLNNSSIPNPVATPPATTEYTIKVRSADGCESEAKTRVIVYRKLLMSSAFTPNGDGLNDIFRIPTGTTLNQLQFSIFDRWGNIVFQTSDINKGWDGLHNGTPLPPGVFVYLIRGNDSGYEVMAKGTVILVK